MLLHLRRNEHSDDEIYRQKQYSNKISKQISLIFLLSVYLKLAVFNFLFLHSDRKCVRVCVFM